SQGRRATTILRLKLDRNQKETAPFRILYVAPTGKLTLNRLIIRGGLAGVPPFDTVEAGAAGAGVLVDGEATLTDVVVRNNDIGREPTRQHPSDDRATTGTGGGINLRSEAGQLMVENSDIINNTVHVKFIGAGGGIGSLGRLSIINSTIDGNIIRAPEKEST